MALLLPSGAARTRSRALATALLATVGAAVVAGSAAAQTPSSPAQPDPAASRAYLDAIRPSPSLQEALDRAVADTGREDPKLGSASLRVAVVDLGRDGDIAIADIRGHDPVYPASVVKFVYLMAAYRWQRLGLLRIDAKTDSLLTAMIHRSSNRATQEVFALLTGTQPGPELGAEDYAVYRRRRLAVKRWLESMGITDLHAVSPTYDGNGDLFGRDLQFLRDRTVAGALPATGSEFPNRQAMTAVGTAKLLALLASDVALGAEDSAAALRHMHRDLHDQPYLVHRIAGGAAAIGAAEVYSKSGTWGPIYADAGIVAGPGGHRFTIAVFTQAAPPYRGDAIAGITRRVAEYVFAPSSDAQGESS